MHTYFYLYIGVHARSIFAASGGRWSQLSAVIHLSWGLISGVNCITQAAATVAPGPARPRPIMLPPPLMFVLYRGQGRERASRQTGTGPGQCMATAFVFKCPPAIRKGPSLNFRTPPYKFDPNRPAFVPSVLEEQMGASQSRLVVTRHLHRARQMPPCGGKSRARLIPAARQTPPCGGESHAEVQCLVTGMVFRLEGSLKGLWLLLLPSRGCVKTNETPII